MRSNDMIYLSAVRAVLLSLLEQIVHAEIKGERLLLRQNGIIRNRGLRQGKNLYISISNVLNVGSARGAIHFLPYII